jgi:hypothetical protein
MRKESSEERVGLVLTWNLILLMHAVVGLEEGGASGQRVADNWKMNLIEADIPKAFGLGVYVELWFLGIVSVFNKAFPLL